jgi:RNA polymerase sigma factor (sigma-70 family)
MTSLAHELARNREALVAFVRKRAGHLVDPEDVVQQAAVRALARADDLRDPARARAWLYRIVRNVMADELRALGLPVHTTDADELSSPEPDTAETCRCSLALVGKLKPEYATLLERVVMQETPITELAPELGVTPNNAMVRLHRARRALRTLMSEHCGTTTGRECSSCECQERGCCATR